MTELRDVVRRLKLDHTVREIQRSTGVHRTIIRGIRVLSEKHRWLSADAPLSTEAEIQAVRNDRAEGQTYVCLLERYYDEFEG